MINSTLSKLKKASDLQDIREKAENVRNSKLGLGGKLKALYQAQSQKDLMTLTQTTSPKHISTQAKDSNEISSFNHQMNPAHLSQMSDMPFTTEPSSFIQGIQRDFVLEGQSSLMPKVESVEKFRI